MKKKPINVVLFFVLGALLLSACGGGTDNGGASNEDVINQAYTQAAETLQAGIAQTEAAQPIPTNTAFVLNSPTPVFLATNTPIASSTGSFPTLAPLSTPTFTQSGPSQPDTIGGRPCLRAELAWETWKDGSKLYTGESFVKTWRLTNSGYCTWTDKFSIAWVGEANLAGNTIYYFKDFEDFPSEGIPNGNALDIKISMQAPSQKGHYRSLWKLRNEKAEYFGVGSFGDEVFWVDIFVREK
jgi:hypothetical protein